MTISENIVNILDSNAISFLNGFARHSRSFDLIAAGIGTNHLTKGAVIPVLWWLWFRGGNEKRDREFLAFGILNSMAAVLVARALANLLPYRERPLRNLALHFDIPFGVEPDSLIHWSSFPSDHAVIFVALSVSILFVSRAAGLLALAYSLLVICLPRVYMGVHYPTDILAGAILGAGIASLAGIAPLRTAATRPALNLMERSPGVFYALLFLITFQIVTTFDSARSIAKGCYALARSSSLEVADEEGSNEFSPLPSRRERARPAALARGGGAP